MKPIIKLPLRFDVSAIAKVLNERSDLWDTNTARTKPENSPHFGLSDIWARYADPATLRDDGSHESVWYLPETVLPVREIVFPLMTAVCGERLGGVLITRIKPGQVCKPHIDDGWHARHYEKFCVQIQSAPGQAFHFHGHSLSTAPGDVFWFDNSHEHWVTNESQFDRISMIVCIRTERT